jgi:hypothetical protein
VIPIALPYPRAPTSDEFRVIERQVYADLDEELVKTFGMEGRDVGGAV